MSHKILVVDDDDDVRSLAVISLEKVGGYEVRWVDSGAHALQELRQWRPDVVVLDVMMPDMDGPEVLARIREHRDLHDVPVVFLTASVVEAELDKLRMSPVSGVLSKPFNPMQLPTDLANLLGW